MTLLEASVSPCKVYEITFIDPYEVDLSTLGSHLIAPLGRNDVNGLVAHSNSGVSGQPTVQPTINPTAISGNWTEYREDGSIGQTGNLPNSWWSYGDLDYLYDVAG